MEITKPKAPTSDAPTAAPARSGRAATSKGFLTALALLGFVVLAVAATAPVADPVVWSADSSVAPHQG